MVRRLRPSEADLLREQPLTYAEAGATLGELPSGYHHLEQSFWLGRGLECFTAASERLMRWQVQERAGLVVTASADVVEVGAVAVVRLGVGPLALRAPVRVVEVVEDAYRRGFAYGTLPGHPEIGEELFVVERDDDALVTLRITAFSRPGTLLARAGGPVSRAVQRAITRRYGRALA